MTNQEAYEKARAWVTRPGAYRAYDDEAGQCMYWTSDINGNVNRCAIGGILSTETALCLRHCEEGVEGLPYDLFRVGGELHGLDVKLLTKLQSAHDSCEHPDPATWSAKVAKKMDDIAVSFGLTVVTT